jgi:osmotically-inducible protein OsmY
MEERDRRWRERGRDRDRDWRRSEDYGRGDPRRFEGGEERSWGGPAEDDRGPYGGRGGGGRDRVFGERETGMGYGGEYRGEGRGRSESRGGQYGRQADRPAWQDRDYQGVSPAMQHGEYDLERHAERYQREHPIPHERGDYYGGDYQGGGYQSGGRYYGDAGREAIYREEWSQGGRDTGPAPRGYDVGRDRDHDRGHFDEDYENRMFASGVASGGTGGYDYERGYGDAGRREGRGERWEQRGREVGRETGEFFRRAGERVASWFGGGERERDDRGQPRDFRGMGPKGYKRNDERISDEVHERLTEDPYVDASNVSVSVSGGEVTLSGTVESREAKHRAERCVEDISGVNHVQNNLRVERGNPLTSPSRGYGDSVLEHQMRGETGSGENLGGGQETRRGGDGGTARASGGTSTDTGKSR